MIVTEGVIELVVVLLREGVVVGVIDSDAMVGVAVLVGVGVSEEQS